MMFETLTSLMVGNPLLGPALSGEAGAGRHRQNSVVAAIDIGAFTDLAAYRAEVDRLIDGLRPCHGRRGSRRSSCPASRKTARRRSGVGGESRCRPERWRTSAASPLASGSRLPAGL